MPNVKFRFDDVNGILEESYSSFDDTTTYRTTSTDSVEEEEEELWGNLNVLLEHEEIVVHILGYLDTVTLIEKKLVCKDWKRLCTQTIDLKCCTGSCGDDGGGGDSGNGQKTKKEKKGFLSNRELRIAVNKYLGYERHVDDALYGKRCTSKDAEEIACVYGYPINNWDTSEVADFSNIFQFKDKFNESIGNWNVSKATTMRGMFYGCLVFNQDLSHWNTSNVQNTTYMFCDAKAFNSALFENVTNIKIMDGMFYDASGFNQDVVTKWNVANCTSMWRLFSGAKAFNQDLSKWDISKVNRMDYMFVGALSFEQKLRDRILEQWNLSSVVKKEQLFG